MTNFQSETRQQIRQAVGGYLGCLTLGTATSTVDNASLLDTLNLNGGDDEFNGRQTRIYDASGSIVDGETSRVSDFAGSTSDATMSPVFSASITTGDKYEMWEGFIIENIDRYINDAISEVTGEVLPQDTDTTLCALPNTYEYDLPSDFVFLHTVEYETETETEVSIEECSTAWSEFLGAGVTVAVDTELFPGGGSSQRVTAAVGAATGILLTQAISSLSLLPYDTVEFWLYSTVALAAGDLQLLLDNTAACASPLESLNIPITTAGRWYHHVISLANPGSDSAIISVGVKMVVDKGAFVFYLREIEAVSSTTRSFTVLSPDWWRIDRANAHLVLATEGKGLIGDEKVIQLRGYRKPALLTTDAAVADIDPAYIKAAATIKALASGLVPNNVDTKLRIARMQYWGGVADRLRRQMRTSFAPGTRAI